MNSVVWLLLAACIYKIHAAPSLPSLPVNPGGIGGLFRGPNQETIIRGPDGSEITSEQLGGAVQTGARLEPIIVPDEISISSVTVSPLETISVSNNIDSLSAAPVVTISENPAQPLHAEAALISQVAQTPTTSISQSLPVDVHTPLVQVASNPTVVATAGEPHIIETEFVDAPDVEPNQNSDLEGPSGSISVRGSSSIVSGPASTTISEPVRKIPINVVPVAAPPILAPSAVLLPPEPSAVDSFQTVNAQHSQASIGLAPQPNYQIPSSSSLSNPELAQPNSVISQVPVTTVRLSDVSSVSPQSQTVSSTPIPPESLPPNAIDLGQTVVSTTQRSSVAPSNADIDVSRINLGQANAQQISSVSAGDSGLLSLSTVSPQDGHIVSTTSAPSESTSTQLPQVQHQNLAIPHQQLFTTASEAYNLQPGVPSTILTPPNQIFTPNRRLYSQDQSLDTNQIVTNDPRVNSNLVGPTSTLENRSNIPQSSWVNVDEDHILPSTGAPLQSGTNIGPISTVLDTVLVQPTDPRNREVIEFGGKKLENVGNIVPVIHHPILVAGGLTNLQHIPTASISQLTSRSNVGATDYGRYGRQVEKKN